MSYKRRLSLAERATGLAGIEPEEIAAAAEALSRLERDHPLLPELERRLSRAGQIKRLLSYCGWRAKHLLQLSSGVVVALILAGRHLSRRRRATRTGGYSVVRSTSMLRATPGWRRMWPRALQREDHLVHGRRGGAWKWRCMSVSAGGRPWMRVQASMKAKYCPCRSVKLFGGHLRLTIHFICASRDGEAR